MRPGLITVLRDGGTWVGGWILVFKQAGILFAPPAQVNEFLVSLAALMIGVPGVAQLLQLRFGKDTSTPASPVPPPSPESSPSSSGGS